MADWQSQKDSVLQWEKEFDRQDSESDFFPTGIAIHDQTIGRIRRGQMAVVAGRPGMGKTAFMLVWALNLLAKGVRVFWFCLELPRVDMMSRIISIKTGVSLFDLIQRRSLTDDEVKRIVGTIPEISQFPASWSEDPNLPDIEQLLNQVPKGSRSIVFVDHLHLVAVPGSRIGDAYGLVSHALLTFKRAAMSLQVPIVVGCQLNRRVEHRKAKVPILSDLKDSGDIEAGAQFVFGLYRPGLDDKSLPDDELQIVCLKNTNGPLRNYILSWDKECARPLEKGLSNGHDKTRDRYEWMNQ